jgi:hypothetical protein
MVCNARHLVGAETPMKVCSGWMIVESFMSLPYSFGCGGGRISIRFPEPVADAVSVVIYRS